MRTRLPALLIFLLLAACAPRSGEAPIADLSDMAQDAGAYHGLAPDVRLISESGQVAVYARFIEAHFAPWFRTGPLHTADDAFWGLYTYADKTLYGENTLPRPGAWMDLQRENSRPEAYPSLDRRAIAVTNTSMRVLPTNRPAFHDPAQAGEGYPFDYMQNSLVLAGTPLHATHESADGAWVLVESRFAFGWVELRDIAWVDDDVVSRFMTGAYAAVTRDDLPIADTDGTYRFTGHVGTVLPVMTREPDGPVCLIPVRTSRGEAVLKAARLTTATTAAMPVPATPHNFTRLANAMLGRQYGWGGLYEDRDCSSFIMDLMAPFGIYLPRNSSQQIKVGDYVSLVNLPSEDKERAIMDRGTPFLTLLRKPGHIMLYIGTVDGRPVVAHSAWGLRTEQGGIEGRRIMGGAVVTSLTPGIELPDLARPDGVYIDMISGMTTLPGGEE